jgi:hypothetical protein
MKGFLYQLQFKLALRRMFTLRENVLSSAKWMRGFELETVLNPKPWCLLRTMMFGIGLLTALGLSGCQIENGGQTLPSPYYMTDDVQYFPAGPEFKLAREAAAMKAYNQEQTPEAPKQP